MKLYHVRTGLLGVNSYFLVDEKTNDAIVIDCGEFYNQLQNVANKYGFRIKAVLLTHAHFDHSGCAKKLQSDGAKIYISKKDAIKLQEGQTLAERFGKKFDSFAPNYTFIDGEILEFGDIKVKVLITPGHTDGSAVFIVENMMFTGDTLLCGTYGRTDFPTGSDEDIKSSINRLFAFDGEYIVYPGHDDFTKLSHERIYNPIKYL